MRCVVIFVVAILAGTGVAAAKELHQDAMNAEGLRKAVVGKALHFATPAGNLSIMFQRTALWASLVSWWPTLVSRVIKVIGGLLPTNCANAGTIGSAARLIASATAGRTNGTLDPQ